MHYIISDYNGTIYATLYDMVCYAEVKALARRISAYYYNRDIRVVQYSGKGHETLITFNSGKEVPANGF